MSQMLSVAMRHRPARFGGLAQRNANAFHAKPRCRAAPNWNPQNVQDPQIMPNLEFDAARTVAVQLEALQKNDDPWMNHGLQTMYEFADDAGSMDRSFYFGFGKDLYHFDHFMGMFRNKLEDLMYGTGFEIISQEDLGESLKVVVKVTDKSGMLTGPFEFVLVRRQLGRKKGAWMTKSLVKLE